MSDKTDPAPSDTPTNENEMEGGEDYRGKITLIFVCSQSKANKAIVRGKEEREAHEEAQAN